jgi:hypothetical protein
MPNMMLTFVSIAKNGLKDVALIQNAIIALTVLLQKIKKIFDIKDGHCYCCLLLTTKLQKV